MRRLPALDATDLAAAIAFALLAGVWAWWATKEGAYFGAVMYPGIVVLCGGLVLLGARSAWGSRLGLGGPTRLALGALLALGTWSALSALWSPSPDVAVADAQRIFGYALAFGLGIWLAILLRGRAFLAAGPLAFAGLVAGAFAVAGMLNASELVRYADKGTLMYPLGYRNANAAFFLIALWPAVTLAATRELDWRLRALALATATLCIELAALSQSRGSIIACVVGLAVFLAVSRERARLVAWLGLAALPALIVIPTLTDFYEVAKVESFRGTSELHAAGRATLIGALIALPLGAVAAVFGGRVAASPPRAKRANRAVAVGAVALALAGIGGFLVTTGDPAGWFGDRVDEFLTQGTPGGEGTSRFNVNAGSERDDFWRVAIESAGEEPVLGLGGGGFHHSYLLNRPEDGAESVLDAHSVELEVLSELGFPGLAMLTLAIGGCALGAWRGRRVGAAESALAACALAAGAYWLVHSSIDWFWTYPALTAPVFALLGSAAAAGGKPSEGRPGGLRRAMPLAAIVLALSVVPPYLSERYVDVAYSGWPQDPERAQEDLDRARGLNPLSIEPLLAAGAIAREQGASERAIAAFEEAAHERPEDWTAYYFLADLRRDTDPGQARADLRAALALNPRSADLAELAERVRRNARRKPPADAG